MNTEALFLFLILLLGLVLCSFLGGNCGKEGLTNNSTVYNGPNGATATISTNSSGTPIITLTQTSGSATVIFTQSSSNKNLYTNPFGFTATVTNDNIVISTPNNGPSQTFTPSSSTKSSSTTSSSSSLPSSTSLSSYFDNYNHYTGSGSSSQLQNGMVFTDTSGNTVTVITNSNGSQSLQLNSVGQSTPMILSSTPASNSNIQPQPNTFYAPYGGVTATITTDSNDQTAIQVNVGNNTVLFVQSGSVSNSQSTTTSSTQYFGSTGTPNQPAPYSLSYTGQDSSATQYYGPNGGSAGYVTGPYGNTAYYAQGPYGNTVAGTTNTYPNYSSNQYYGPNGGTAGSVTGPYGNTAYYAQGPYGNTVAGTTTSNNYYDSLPSGIPASQIPPGQEDLYILKSEVVPPVCPACPQSSACPRQEPCPPCPACARCPEPAFECKKVPNYDVIDSDYLPTPMLNDFSSFGM
jgi:hypothetical protein